MKLTRIQEPVDASKSSMGSRVTIRSELHDKYSTRGVKLGRGDGTQVSADLPMDAVQIRAEKITSIDNVSCWCGDVWNILLIPCMGLSDSDINDKLNVVTTWRLCLLYCTFMTWTDCKS